MADLAATFERLAADAAARCTECGRCAEVCPTARETGVDRSDPSGLVRGLMALAQSGSGAAEASRWVNACDGSGQCSAVCPEEINVRQWVSIAKLRAAVASRTDGERREEAAHRFRTMSHAVRLLASMQMPSEALRRILAPAERRRAELIFYTGCNVLKTSHIVFNVMDILDTLGVDFDVVGGPSHCCGVYQFQAGDSAAYDRVGGRTFQRLGESGAQRVLTWCPTCTKNFGEIETDRAPPSFGLDHVSVFLAAELERMRPRFVDLPPRRAVIHEHRGIPGTRESVRALMEAIPNLTVLDLPQDSGFSYACGGVAARYVERERAIHRNMAEGAVALGADLLITTYHSCHRALAGAEALYPFRVVNFTDLIAEALGKGGRTDFYKLYKSGGEMSDAVKAARVHLESHGLTVSQESIDALAGEMFGETGLADSPDAFRAAFAPLASR
ncbi:MAG: (Fe-S)-binding protein [Alphaproteobacteria bacterium]|nr:(Fe-S)-binding protein [Alphaproteobacteria bacterium]